MNFQGIFETVGRWVVTSGIQILLIVVLLAIALRFVDILMTRMLRVFNMKHVSDAEMKKRTDTLASVMGNVLRVLLFTLAVLMIMKEFGIDIGPIIAAAGVVGIAVGFGAQNLVKDVIGGLFILMEDQIRVGDVVDVGGKSGLVEKINIRTLILRDQSGNVHYIRNGNIEIVTNMTKDYSRYIFDVGIDYREDVEQVIGVLRSIDEDMRSDPSFKDDILEPLEVLGVERFEDSAVVIRVVNKTLPIKQWGVAREFNKRLKKAFEEHGILMPYPQQVVHITHDQDEAPHAAARSAKTIKVLAKTANGGHKA